MVMPSALSALADKGNDGISLLSDIGASDKRHEMRVAALTLLAFQTGNSANAIPPAKILNVAAKDKSVPVRREATWLASSLFATSQDEGARTVLLQALVQRIEDDADCRVRLNALRGFDVGSEKEAGQARASLAAKLKEIEGARAREALQWLSAPEALACPKKAT